jgi:hypothetical protein
LAAVAIRAAAIAREATPRLIRALQSSRRDIVQQINHFGQAGTALDQMDLDTGTFRRAECAVDIGCDFFFI